jgi:hypothetical protein
MSLKHLKVVRHGRHKASLYLCHCGNEKIIRDDHVTSGRTVSCGCARGTHHKSHLTEYKIWEGIIQRCTNKRSSNYVNYGGRGISVAERWRKFENFYADMGSRPKGASIDRIDNNGSYTRENCQWAMRAQQQRNKRTTIRVIWNNQPMALIDVAKLTGLHYGRLRYRVVDLGLSIQEAVDLPVRKGGHIRNWGHLEEC